VIIIFIIIIISGYYKDSLSQQKYVTRTFIMWDCGTDLSLIREQPTGFSCHYALVRIQQVHSWAFPSSQRPVMWSIAPDCVDSLPGGGRKCVCDQIRKLPSPQSRESLHALQLMSRNQLLSSQRLQILNKPLD